MRFNVIKNSPKQGRCSEKQGRCFRNRDDVFSNRGGMGADGGAGRCRADWMRSRARDDVFGLRDDVRDDVFRSIVPTQSLAGPSS